MKRRIAKKQQKAAQRKQEQLQAAWDVVSKKLSEQKEAHCFFVERNWKTSSIYRYRIHNLGDFEMLSHNMNKRRVEVQR